MAETEATRLPDGGAPDGPRLTPNFIRHLLAEIDPEVVRARIAELHAADVADLIERISPDDRVSLLDTIRPVLDPAVLPELDEIVRGALIENLPPGELAGALAALDDDDAAEVVADLDAPMREKVMADLPETVRATVEEALAHGEGTVGRLMQRMAVVVPEYWTVGQTIDHLRDARDLPDMFHDVFVVDRHRRPVGGVALSRILRNRRPTALGDLTEGRPTVLSTGMDQEEAAFLFRQQDLTSAAVVDDEGRLVGVLTIDDVVDVMDEEHEEDMLKLGGVGADDFYHAVTATTARRFPWLFVNLLTAVAASVVIAQFEDAIAAIVALAVLMPIVASMGGNAGTQTLTVTVRALATRELSATNALRIVCKEILVGGANGILFALVTAAMAFLWFDSWAIGGVIAAAMVINLVVAGLLGVTIPLALDRMGVDPAVASSILLTTVTDVVGFLAFLGLAAAWLL